MKVLRRERAFERVVGLIGRRGYELVGVKADLTDEGAAMQVSLTLESDRSAETLARQLRKLVEVVEVWTEAASDG